MAFFDAFLNFISWVFMLDCFRLTVSVVCFFAGWFCMSELVRYFLNSGGEKDDN